MDVAMINKGVVVASVVLSSSACDADSQASALARAEQQAEQEFRLGLSADFEAAYIDCDEFAGVGVVELANVIDRVPSDYTIVQPFPGAAIVVAQAGSCAEISVSGWNQPGVFAQFGVAVVPPGEPGSGDFFQLAYATSHPLLAARLRIRGANARFTPFLSYEITEAPELFVDVPRPLSLAFELDGPITLPDPAGPPNPTTVFNYFAQSPLFGNVRQSNVVEGIRFGEGSGVTLTAVGMGMEQIVGGETLTFPFFSSPEVFDQADLIVETNAF